MVIGNGLVARSFAHLQDDPGVIIFASGVSNSQTTDQNAYDRERRLIHTYRMQEALFVYFSTVSVRYPCMSESPYVRFKLSIEEEILDTFPRAVIFRLPNLVGHTQNPHTLTNYLFDAVQSGREFEVHGQATRYLLDVEDMAAVCAWHLLQFKTNTLHEIVFDNKVRITEIVRSFETLLGVRANSRIVEKGCDMTVSPVSGALLDRLGISFPDGPAYNQRILHKYYAPKV